MRIAGVILCALTAVIICSQGVLAMTAEEFSEEIEKLNVEYKTEYIPQVSFTVGSNIMRVDDSEKEIDTMAVNKDDRVFIPLRAFAEAMAAQVEYTGDITVKADGICAVLKPDSTKFRICFSDGTEQTEQLEAAPFINAQNRTMIPIRAAEQLFACDVKWNGENQSVSLERIYQKKRLLVKQSANELDFSLFAPERTLFDGSIYVLQFNLQTPDIRVKKYCDKLNQMDTVKFAEPDRYLAIRLF